VTRWDDPAAWYDVLNPWGPSDDFYLGLVMGAGRVLDVGCGTGTRAALSGAWWDRPQVGHGTLRFLDPDSLAAFLDDAGFAVARGVGHHPPDPAVLLVAGEGPVHRAPDRPAPP
jgi:SAM-dependent methyltransferase